MKTLRRRFAEWVRKQIDVIEADHRLNAAKEAAKLAERRAENARASEGRMLAKFDDMRAAIVVWKAKAETRELLIHTLHANGDADKICREVIETAWEQGLSMDTPLFRAIQEHAGTGGGREAKNAAWRTLREQIRGMGGEIASVPAFHLPGESEPLLEEDEDS